MEKQGIITGIGNTITPEIDAVINEYIVGKNTILKGLGLNGNILSAGTCILCGYRGTLENSQTVDGNYVYGKFVIGVNETDSFSIITSSNSNEPTDGIINPTSITNAGTYYLRLYANGASQVDSERYPKQAHTSYNADHLQPNGTIASTAKTDTAPVNDNSGRVANTKYVHNQIEYEVNEGEATIQVYQKDTHIANILLRRRAKYVIGTITSTKNVASNAAYGATLNIPQGFTPDEDVMFLVGYNHSVGGGEHTASMKFEISAGTNIAVDSGGASGYNFVGWKNTDILTFGYKCK